MPSPYSHVLDVEDHVTMRIIAMLPHMLIGKRCINWKDSSVPNVGYPPMFDILKRPAFMIIGADKDKSLHGFRSSGRILSGLIGLCMMSIEPRQWIFVT